MATKATKAIRVRAKDPGFYGGVRRRRGDEFDVAEERHVGKWMVRVDADAEGAEAGDAAGSPSPNTLSQMGREAASTEPVWPEEDEKDSGKQKSKSKPVI